jgi:hypothetical protein
LLSRKQKSFAAKWSGEEKKKKRKKEKKKKKKKSLYLIKPVT